MEPISAGIMAGATLLTALLSAEANKQAEARALAEKRRSEGMAAQRQALQARGLAQQTALQQLAEQMKGVFL